VTGVEGREGVSVEWERAGDGSLVLKVKLPPSVEPPSDVEVVSLEPLVVVGGVREAVAKAVLGDAKPENAKQVLRYPGGDHYLINELKTLFERAPGVDAFVEVFGGGGVASYIVARDLRRKFEIVVYNDVDDLLVNFFRVLREKPHELVRLLALVPYARRERERCYLLTETGGIRKLGDVERAAAYFFLLRLSVNAVVVSPSAFRSSAVRDVAGQLNNVVAALPEFAKVWKRIQIENLDFRKCIERFDTPRTLFYCDPPHLSLGHRRDLYRYGFTVKDMHDLIKLLSRVRGKFVLKLPEDHLEVPFIREFAERYSVERIVVNRYTVVDEGEEREKLGIALIHNFGDRSSARLETWL
jgi:DNA adenine methylase